MKMRVLLLVLGSMLAACGPSSFEGIATEHEDKLSDAAAKIEKDRVTGLLKAAREEGGVVDLGNGTAIVRFKLGAKFQNGNDALKALRSTAKEWADAQKVTFTEVARPSGHT